MASTYTGATNSTSPSTGSTRKRGFSLGGDPPPGPKKQKRPTKLDDLKAALQGEVRNLRDKLTNVRKVLLDERFAKESAGLVYIALLDSCDTILGGENYTPGPRAVQSALRR